MRAKRISITVLAVLTCALLVGVEPKAASTNEAVLTVRVQNAAGSPLRACITVISPNHTVANFCQVDHDGVTTIPNLPREKYRVSAKSSGYVMQQQEIDMTTGNGEVAFTLQAK
jgi:hypothetical protein